MEKEKSFYFIKIDCSKTYKPICDLVKSCCAKGISWYQETGFSYFVNCKKIIYSCEKDKRSAFENILKENSVDFQRVDALENDYNLYLSQFEKPLNNRVEIPEENQNIIADELFPKIIEGCNGSIVLNEHIIKYEDKIKIYIESKERCKHSIPHAHVDYNNDRNVFSISLSNFEILAGNSGGAKAKKAIEILKNNIDKARKMWNEKSDSHSKFLTDNNGNFLSEYEFTRDSV